MLKTFKTQNQGVILFMKSTKPRPNDSSFKKNPNTTNINFFHSGLKNSEVNIETLLLSFDQINYNGIVGEQKTWNHTLSSSYGIWCVHPFMEHVFKPNRFYK